MKIWGQRNDLRSPWAILENWYIGSQQPGLPLLPMGCTLPFFSCLYSFFNSLPHAICQISYKMSPIHTHRHTGTEEPSADPGIDSKNSHLHRSSGFIQWHLPQLFVCVCNAKSSVLLLELSMLSNCFQNSSPRCIWHLPTGSKQQQWNTKMCVCRRGMEIFTQVTVRIRLRFLVFTGEVKKKFTGLMPMATDHFSRFWGLKYMRFFQASLNRVLGSMNSRWLVYEMSSRFKLLNPMLSTDNSDFMWVWGFSHCYNQVT